MNRTFFFFFSFLLLCGAGKSYARTGLKLHSTFGDGMVLQQQTEVELHGTARPGDLISVTCGWQPALSEARAGREGSWTVRIPTPAASCTPYTITVRSADGEIVLNDVLVGEVWLCSGQSNMEMPLRGFPSQPVAGAFEELLLASRYKNLRLFTVGRNTADEPQADCEGEWEKCTPENAALFSALGYLFGRRLNDQLDVPVGIIVSSYGGSRIESWLDKASMEKYDTTQYIAKADVRYRDPNTLYNGMVAPLTRFPVRGVVWYQGESNRRNAGVYESMLTDLFSLWRREWNNASLPFIVCQLCPCPYNGPGVLGAVRIMEAQSGAVRKTPGTYIVGTSDVGDPKLIHAPLKIPIAERITAVALSRVYGIEGLPFSGPLFREAEFTGGKALVRFDHAERGLSPMNTDLEDFELAGADRIFYPAKARVGADRATVEVSCEEVPQPVAVRFAFQNWHRVGLRNNYGLPAFPFRTDCWPVEE